MANRKLGDLYESRARRRLAPYDKSFDFQIYTRLASEFCLLKQSTFCEYNSTR